MNKISQINLYDPGQGNLKGFGALGLETASGTPIQIFTKFISSTIGLISLIAMIWFVFTLVLGGLGLITSGGDKNTLDTSKKKITNGAIGLLVTIFAIFIIRIIGFIFGIPDLLNPTAIFEKLIIR